MAEDGFEGFGRCIVSPARLAGDHKYKKCQAKQLYFNWLFDFHCCIKQRTHAEIKPFIPQNRCFLNEKGEWLLSFIVHRFLFAFYA